MLRFAAAPQAIACVVGIALFLGGARTVSAQTDPQELGLTFDAAEPAPAINSKFRSDHGWIGGESAQSVDLGHGRTLWLYGDTWVGSIKDGRRSQARVVHNSVGLQCSPEAPCEFIVNRNELQRPVDFLAPADGRGWIWFQSGLMIRNRLYLFLAQFEKAVEFPAVQHRQLGTWLAIVENPEADPRDWCINQVPLPFCTFSKYRDVTYGLSAVVDGDHLYVYGADDQTRVSSDRRFLTVARVPLDQIAEMDQWRFYRRERWGRDHASASHLADFMAGEMSIAYLPGVKKYLAVYTDTGISSRIVARTAPTPVGPWSGVTTLHRCHEATGDPRLFCYAGKAHPTLSTDGKLVISYLASSVDPWQVATEARLYWPIFMTVGIHDAQSPTPIATVANTGAEE